MTRTDYNNRDPERSTSECAGMTACEIEHALSGMRGKLLGVAGRFMKASGIAEDEEDIVQEALTELWMLFESGYAIRNAEALAVKITKTVCVRHFRKRKIQTSPIDGIDCPGGMPASGNVDMSETLKLRKSLMDSLSATQKRYLMMRNERDMSLDEIAAETGRPKSSIKATISQARRIMNEYLTKLSK